MNALVSKRLHYLKWNAVWQEQQSDIKYYYIMVCEEGNQCQYSFYTNNILQMVNPHHLDTHHNK